MNTVRQTATRRFRLIAAAAVFLGVSGVTIWAQIPVGAGTYYDDGVYLALAQSLAEGDGYRYANLPGAVPGVKYPPLFPSVLAAGWNVFSTYPNNLGPLKGLNAAIMGLAASLAFLLFARGRRRRTLVMASVALFGFLSIPSLSMSTVLISEPLFLLTAAAALLASERLIRVVRSSEPVLLARGVRLGQRPEAMALVVGGLAAATFLTRSIGLAVVAAVVIAALIRSGTRSAIVVMVAAALPSTAWLWWSQLRAGAVPEGILGQYGSYLAWLGSDSAGGTWEAIVRIGRAHWPPLVETLQFVWVPRSPDLGVYVVLALAAVAFVAGLRSVWRRSPALALFVPLYFAIVFAWPYEPYRFYYAILPFIHLIVATGVLAGVRKFRLEFPSWGMPVGALAGSVLLLNTLSFQLQGLANKAWASTQTIPAAAYNPLAAWIRANTSPDAVIASGLDPYLYWETGRKTVPSWDFSANDYGAYDRRADRLAAGFDRIRYSFDPSYVAVIEGDYKAAHALDAYLELHPDRLEKVYETEDLPNTGVIFRLRPGESGEVTPPTSP
ncbi:MAG: hypothetical protein V3U67_06930 [Gemmatimonadota bacterium]